MLNNGTSTLGKVINSGESLECEDIPNVYLKCEICGNIMRVAVPRQAVELEKDNFTLWFKVADSREKYNNIEDFYDKGDTAPLCRLNLVYNGK